MPLSETGHRQAETLAARCKHLNFDHLVVSSFLRAQQTAAPIAEATKVQPVSSELFTEFVRPSRFIDKPRSSEEYQRFSLAEYENIHNPDWRYADEESFAEVMQRVAEAVEYLKSLEGDVLVVSHGRFLKYIYTYLLCEETCDPHVWQLTRKALYGHNTGITLFEYSDDGWKLITFNDTAHFAE